MPAAQFPDPLFNPLDWYWYTLDGRIYSSKRNVLVYAYDSAYLAFIAVHGAATPWPIDGQGKQTTASLQTLMSKYQIVLPFT
jgi:hypothetical protein